MNIINIEHLTHSFTERLLFDDVSFYLSDKDKVGVIGINGTGKSTLLKIIAGKETADRADIIMQRDLRIAYLPQIPEFADTHTTLSGALPLTEEISDQPENYIPQAKSMLHQLGFTRYDQPITELSGGQRKRIALVRTLLTPADVLILDEPTNHLDSAMAEWLEKTLRATLTILEDYLNSFSGIVITVSHDRYFLDSVTNAIVEIDKSKLYRYEGNYLYYLEHKAMREEIARATERKRQSILRVEIEWMKRGARARSTKQKAHIARYEALRDMDAPVTDDTVTISSVSSRLGRTTIELDHISKAYEDAVLMQDFTYTFLRDDRIGIIGPNGCGKSTLLKIILGEITPDKGTVTIGQTVKIGYFSQESTEMDPSLRVIDYVKEGGELVQTADGTISASAMLERFLFPKDQQYTKIAKLSGGERRRLYLLRILMEAPNILLLDEPTNDLDIATLTILEDYLDQFAGIVITISHDRYFLDRIVRRIFAFEKGGVIRQYEGGYTDYLAHTNEVITVADAGAQGHTDTQAVVSSDGPSKNTRDNWKKGHTHTKKMSYQEQKDYETIEQDIASLEEQLEQLEQDIAGAATDFVRLNELTAQKSEIEAALEQKMDRWMYLEELAEELGLK
mgnify:CR=1 FL=1